MEINREPKAKERQTDRDWNKKRVKHEFSKRNVSLPQNFHENQYPHTYNTFSSQKCYKG